MVKLSYSTKPSMASKIGAHNNKVEANNEELGGEERLCSCPKTKGGFPFACEWGGKCMEGNTVYSCKGLKPNGSIKWEYLGITKGSIKEWISNHYTSFKKIERKNETELSKKMWKEKEEQIVTTLNWSKIAYAKARSANQKSCNLCNKETLLILRGALVSLMKGKN